MKCGRAWLLYRESQAVLVPFAVFMVYHLFGSIFPRLTVWAKYPSLRDPRGFGFDVWPLRWRKSLAFAPDRSTVVGPRQSRVGWLLRWRKG